MKTQKWSFHFLFCFGCCMLSVLFKVLESSLLLVCVALISLLLELIPYKSPFPDMKSSCLALLALPEHSSDKPLQDPSPESICISLLPTGMATMITLSKIALFIFQYSLVPYYALFITSWHYITDLCFYHFLFIHMPLIGWYCMLLPLLFLAPKSVPGT